MLSHPLLIFEYQYAVTLKDSFVQINKQYGRLNLLRGAAAGNNAVPQGLYVAQDGLLRRRQGVSQSVSSSGVI